MCNCYSYVPIGGVLIEIHCLSHKFVMYNVQLLLMRPFTRGIYKICKYIASSIYILNSTLSRVEICVDGEFAQTCVRVFNVLVTCGEEVS